jgi:hypothetical protein
MKKKMNKEFVVYCPEADELIVLENNWEFDYNNPMEILAFISGKKYALTFIGEL